MIQKSESDKKNDALNDSNIDEPDNSELATLKKELREEITRLRNQFKAQKTKEKELEEERKRLKLESEKLTLKRHDIGITSPPTGMPVKVGDAVDRRGGSTAPEPQSPVSFEIFERFERELEVIKKMVEQKADEDHVKQLLSQQQEVSDIDNKLTEFSKLMSSTKKELKKIDIKLSDVLEDIGYEEGLDLSKVPPEILELVYETIIEDVLARIKHDLGAQDTELTVIKTLEEIRFRTSGSELFKFENGMFKLKNLGKYIKQKSISAKQIQTTFEELITKLIENTPDYQPKNFKAMIKIKSQEFSLDRVMEIFDQFKKIEKSIDNLDSNVTKLTKDTQELEDAKKMTIGEFNSINTRMSELAQKLEERTSSKVKVKPTIPTSKGETKDKGNRKDNGGVEKKGPDQKKEKDKPEESDVAIKK